MSLQMPGLKLPALLLDLLFSLLLLLLFLLVTTGVGGTAGALAPAV